MTKDSSSTDNQNQQFPPHPYPYCPPHAVLEDEISLIDLFRVLVKRKMLIIIVTVLVTLSAIGYALSIPPIYRARAIFLPPSVSDIQMLNAQGVSGVGVASIYDAYQQNLKSYALQRRFVEEQGLMKIFAPEQSSDTSVEMTLQAFSKMLMVDSNDKSSAALSLSIEWGDPAEAALWVNQFASLADRATVHQLTTDLEGTIATKTKDIESTIASKRALTKQRREDQITRLDEALLVAKSLGISERINASNVIQSIQPVGNISVNTASTPLYTRGSKALEAEISVLRNRKNDDAFIPELRNLQEELSRLRSIHIDEKGAHAMTVDQAAYPPSSRIKPKRTLIVTLGAVLGLMLGVFTAFFMNFLESHRKEESAGV